MASVCFPRWIFCCTREQEEESPRAATTTDSMHLQLVRKSEAPPRSLSGTTAFSDITAKSLCIPGHDTSTFSTSVSLETEYYSSYPSSAGGVGAARFAIDIIRQSIYGSRIQSACGAEKWFIPQLTLEALMSTRTGISLVLGELALRPDNVRLRLINQILMGTSIGKEKDSRIYRKIFAILLLIHKHDEIKRFVDEGVDDSNLPLRRVELKSGQFGLAPYNDLGRKAGSHIQLFDSWTVEQKNDFIRLQWEMIPVFFRKHDERVPHLKLLAGEILPYTVETGGPTTEVYNAEHLQGGFGHVSIYNLHSLQQDINRYTVGQPQNLNILSTCLDPLRANYQIRLTGQTGASQSKD